MSLEVYVDCECGYEWIYSQTNKPFYGLKSGISIPQQYEFLGCEGNQCGEFVEGVDSGLALDFYLYLEKNTTIDDLDKLKALANHLDQQLESKEFAFYGFGMEAISAESRGKISKGIKQQFIREGIFTREKYDELFPHLLQARNEMLIVSTVDLRKDIPPGYNARSVDYITEERYEYSFKDLAVRYKHLYVSSESDLFANLVRENEKNGTAEAISIDDGAAQYIAQYGTNSAFPFYCQSSSGVVPRPHGCLLPTPDGSRVWRFSHE